MVPLNMTCLHCLQHSLFVHLFNLYLFLIRFEAPAQDILYSFIKRRIFSIRETARYTHTYYRKRDFVKMLVRKVGFVYLCFDANLDTVE